MAQLEKLEAKVAQLRELRRLEEELSAEIADLEDGLKAYMTDNDTDTLLGGDFKITWKPITSSRLDSKALKAEQPDIWSRYCKTATTRRFILA